MFKNKMHLLIGLLIIFAILIGSAIYMKKCNSVIDCVLKAKNHMINKSKRLYNKFSESFKK